MPEGTVEIDQGGAPTLDPNYSDDSQETESQESQETETQETQETQEVDNQSEEQLTEKGTKLDTNPLSAANQQLANARKLIGQYEQVLNNPNNLKAYASQMGMTLAEAKQDLKDAKSEAKQEIKQFEAGQFKTSDDVAKALNEMQTNFAQQVQGYQKQIEELQSQLGGYGTNQRLLQVATRMQNDTSTIREKYPELNPKSPEYDKALEEEIGSLFNEVDFDPQSNSYKGQVSLLQFTDRIMAAAGKARKKGSQQAQTDIKQKQAGKVVTSSKKTTGESKESDNPGTAIAQRISKMYGATRK